MTLMVDRVPREGRSCVSGIRRTIPIVAKGEAT